MLSYFEVISLPGTLLHTRKIQYTKFSGGNLINNNKKEFFFNKSLIAGIECIKQLIRRTKILNQTKEIFLSRNEQDFTE